MSILAGPKTTPILFRDSMVRAIAEGRKDVTRRLYKGGFVYDGETGIGASWEPDTPCHYGEPGDLLAVREAWALVRPIYLGAYDETPHLDGFKEWEGKIPDRPPGDGWIVVYRSDDWWNVDAEERGFRWRPSIFLPRWAWRTYLEITAVSFERLTDMPDEHLAREGYGWDVLIEVAASAASRRDLNVVSAWTRQAVRSTLVAYLDCPMEPFDSLAAACAYHYIRIPPGDRFAGPVMGKMRRGQLARRAFYTSFEASLAARRKKHPDAPTWAEAFVWAIEFKRTEAPAS